MNKVKGLKKREGKFKVDRFVSIGVIVLFISLLMFSIDVDALIIGGRNGGYHNGTMDEVRIWNIILSVGDVLQHYYSNLNKYDMDKWNFRSNQSNLSIGTYTYQEFAEDIDGYKNSTELRYLFIIEVDTTAPIISLISPVDKYVTKNTTNTFTCSITDNRQIANLTLYIWNSTGDNIYVDTTSLTGLSNQTNWTLVLPYEDSFSWNCLGYDETGNNEWAGNNNTLIYDLTIPSVSFVWPTTITGIYSQDYITANVSVIDSDLDTVNIYLYDSTGLWSSQESSLYTFFWNFSGLFDGVFYLNASANDTGGNIGSSETRTILLDTIAPAWMFNSTSVSSITKYNDPVMFGITWSDVNIVDSIIFSWNGTNGGELMNDSAINCGVGICQEDVSKVVNFIKGDEICWKWYANDSAGNWNETDEWCFTVGNTAPQFNETLMDDLVYTGALYSKQINCADVDNDPIIYYDNVPQFDISGTGLINWVPTFSDAGDLSVEIICGDGESNTSQTYTLSVVSSLRINITSPKNGTVLNYSYDVPFSFTTNMIANCSYRLDNWSYVNLQDVIGYNTNFNIYSNREHNVTVNCTSYIFNATKISVFTINDTIPPKIIASSPSGVVVVSTINLSVITDENATCRYIPSTEGNISTNYTSMHYNFSDNDLHHNKTRVLANNYYEFYARCRDNLGNVMDASENISFTVDVEIRIITVPRPGGGGGGGRREITKKVILELDAPSNQTLFSGDEIEILIKLKNKGELALKNIKMEAETNAPNMSLILYGKSFDKLGIGEERGSVLKIRSLANAQAHIGINRYFVVITANVSDPSYKTSIRFFIDVSEINYEARMATLKNIQFVEDLFKEHPECLEFNEIIKQAQYYYDESEYDKAISMIDSAIQACRDLIAAEEYEMPAPKKKADMIIFGIEMLLLLALILAMVYYLRKRRKGKPVKAKSNLELRFDELFNETERLMRNNNLVRARGSYVNLRSVYNTIRTSSLSKSVKTDCYKRLSGLYSKLFDRF